MGELEAILCVWQSPRVGREGTGTLLNQRRKELASGVPDGEAGSSGSRRRAK